MLKNIDKNISPELLKVLCEMGHGDEIVIADGNFPGSSLAKRIIRADGLGGREILKGVMSLIPLDSYSNNAFLMELSECDKGKVNPLIWKDYEEIIFKNDKNLKLAKLERQEFYDRAKNAYAVIQTGETAIYANIIIRKGVI